VLDSREATEQDVLLAIQGGAFRHAEPVIQAAT
jgi:hypothetical protein